MRGESPDRKQFAGSRDRNVPYRIDHKNHRDDFHPAGDAVPEPLPSNILCSVNRKHYGWNPDRKNRKVQDPDNRKFLLQIQILESCSMCKQTENESDSGNMKQKSEH